MSSGERRHGHVIMVSDRIGSTMTNDAEMVTRAFSKQGFQFSKSIGTSRVKVLEEAVYDITKMGDGLHLIYIIAKVSNSKIIDGHDERIRVRGICKILKNTKAKKIIIIQLNLHKGDNLEFSDLSHGKGPDHLIGRRPGPKLKSLPRSTDMMLLYLPRFVHHKGSSVNYLCNVLKCSPDLDEALVFLTREVAKSGAREFPSYTSTMRRRIPLYPEASGGGHRVITGGKLFGFYVEQFRNPEQRLDADPEIDFITGAFEEIGFEVTSRKGKIVREYILDKVERIADEQRRRASPMLVLLFSSHGSGEGRISTSNRSINITEVLERLEDLDHVTKLILVEACRGGGCDNSAMASKSCGGVEEKLSLELPLNSLLVWSTSEGNKSFAPKSGSTFLRELCSKMHHSVKHEGGDVFTILHHVMSEIASEDNTRRNGIVAKQQVMFASSLTKPLRLRIG